MYDIHQALEIWADYIRGGRQMRGYGDCVLSKFMEGTDDQPSGVHGSTVLLSPMNTAERMESLVCKLNTLKPKQAKVLRTEYGLTRFWDPRTQAHRAAKMNIKLRTYEYNLHCAKSQVEEWWSER